MISISQAATTYLEKKIVQEKGLGIRLSIKKTGCSGYQYCPEIVHSVHEQDLLINMQTMLVYLDHQWISILEGIHIDYIEDNHQGLKQKRLLITNPKEVTRCGCGESFTLT